MNVLEMMCDFRDMWGSRIDPLVVGERERARARESGAAPSSNSKDLTVSETYSLSNPFPLYILNISRQSHPSNS